MLPQGKEGEAYPGIQQGKKPTRGMRCLGKDRYPTKIQGFLGSGRAFMIRGNRLAPSGDLALLCPEGPGKSFTYLNFPIYKKNDKKFFK